MGFLRRMRGLSNSWNASERVLLCPVCGVSGYDNHHFSTEAEAAASAAFEVRGQYKGKAVRKCLRCGSGFLVGGARATAIEPQFWERMEQYFAEETGRFDERMRQLREPSGS